MEAREAADSDQHKEIGDGDGAGERQRAEDDGGEEEAAAQPPCAAGRLLATAEALPGAHDPLEKAGGAGLQDARHEGTEAPHVHGAVVGDACGARVGQHESRGLLGVGDAGDQRRYFGEESRQPEHLAGHAGEAACTYMSPTYYLSSAL